MASCWYASWKVEPLPWRVPETFTVVVAPPPLAAVVVAPPAVVVAPPPEAAVVAVVVALPPLLELSDPQAAPTRARASTPAMAVPRRLVMFTLWSPLFVKPPSTLRRAGELAWGDR